MNAQAKKVMDLAASYIGTKENPPYSNNVIFNTHYYGGNVSGSGFAWCCSFVWDIFRMAGLSKLFYNGNKTAYCPAVQTWGRSSGQAISKSAGTYGDIVLFDWNNNDDPDHIGLIEKKNSDGSYTTIEGNTGVGNDSNGGEVMRRVRYQSQISCIIRPKYSNENVNGEKVCEVELKQLSKGSKGSDVRTLQWLLTGYGHHCGEPAGIFGAKTDAAVKAYQKDQKLTVDGIVGSKTWSNLLTVGKKIVQQEGDTMTKTEILTALGDQYIKTFNDLPQWARKDVRTLLDKGYIKGILADDPDDIHMFMSDIRNLIVSMRMIDGEMPKAMTPEVSK